MKVLIQIMSPHFCGFIWRINLKGGENPGFLQRTSGGLAMAPWLSPNPTLPGPLRGATPRQLGPGDVCETSSLVTIRKEAPRGTAEFPGVAGRFFFVSADGNILVKYGEIQKSNPMFCW